MMLKKIGKMQRKGTALLVVLFIVIAATIISLGFLSRSDIELACGKNMVIRTQMDYLSESGLEHAKGLILNPQDIESEYWVGIEGQQLMPGFGDYYDVEVNKIQERDYLVNCQSYRIRNGQNLGRSILEAKLWLYPCIGLWTNNSTSLLGNATIHGDVYCQDTFLSNGTINGDAFVSVLNASITGKQRSLSDLSLDWPSVEAVDYTSRFPVVIIDTNSVADTTFGPYEPVKVCYREGDLSLDGMVQVSGILIVNGSLTITGLNNIFISEKNLPALLVTGSVNIEGTSELDVTGLVLVNSSIQIDGQLNVVGSLFSNGSISGGGTLNISASGSKASIVTWTSENELRNWSPAAGAVYRSIVRK
ncbi:MAG: hypothetical protein ACYTFM_06265 [Planctomycetota bacterium]